MQDITRNLWKSKRRLSCNIL